MIEMWESLRGKDKGFEVSNQGRVRGKLGRLIPVDERSVVRGRPAVLIRGELRPVKALVGSLFGEDVGVVAEFILLGEAKLLDRRARIETELETIAEALVAIRAAPPEPFSTHEIREGQDLSALFHPPVTPRSIRDLALEEARHLGEVYRSGVEVDPGTSMTRQEVEVRLRRLQGMYGPEVAETSQVTLPALPPVRLSSRPSDRQLSL